jgi:hypothetical protein
MSVREKIEKLVEDGFMREGDTAEVARLARADMVLTEASFAGDKRYEVRKVVNIVLGDDNETYTLHVRYLGGQDA